MNWPFSLCLRTAAHRITTVPANRSQSASPLESHCAVLKHKHKRKHRLADITAVPANRSQSASPLESNAVEHSGPRPGRRAGSVGPDPSGRIRRAGRCARVERSRRIWAARSRLPRRVGRIQAGCGCGLYSAIHLSIPISFSIFLSPILSVSVEHRPDTAAGHARPSIYPSPSLSLSLSPVLSVSVEHRPDAAAGHARPEPVHRRAGPSGPGRRVWLFGSAWPNSAVVKYRSGQMPQWSNTAVVKYRSGLIPQWSNTAVAKYRSGQIPQWSNTAVVKYCSGQISQWRDCSFRELYVTHGVIYDSRTVSYI